MPLSTKDLNYLKDQLTTELLLAKKYYDYSQQVTDTQLQQTLDNLGRKHQNNYSTLLNYLS